MADDLEDLAALEPEKGHGWNSLDDYIYQHYSRLANIDFVAEVPVFEIERFYPSPRSRFSLLRLRGDILCCQQTVIHVAKFTLVRERRGGREEARTLLYGYHAYKRRGTSILRYDNWHSDISGGQVQGHHKHVFDTNTGVELPGSPFPSSWPHMHEVVIEVGSLMSTPDDN